MSHAYSLIDTFNIDNGIRLCNLRNPWGKLEWKGSWSDNDTRWTPELKKHVGFTKENDGKFFMSFDDFRNNFGRVDICYV